ALDHERPGGPRRDEVDELAEERLLAMLRVVRLAELPARGQQLPRANREAARLDAAENLRREAAPDGVRLDQDQRLLDGHRPRRLAIRATTAPGLERRHRDSRRLDRGLAVRAHLPERLERRLAVRAHEERDVDLGPAHGAVEVALREPVLHRLDLELALANVLEVLRRPEEH